ncbi:hypothetical protein GC194_12675 [bacterium]|nr:hypothetical protein [bacterium]
MPLPFLQSAYPVPEKGRRNLLTAFFFGVFVALFLYFFKPFGLHFSANCLLGIALGYGFITFACTYVVQVLLFALFASYYNESQWNTGRNIINAAVILGAVSVANFLWGVYCHFTTFSLTGLATFTSYTLGVGIFPVVLLTLYTQNKWQRNYTSQSAALSAHLPGMTAQIQEIDLLDEEGRVALTTSAEKLLFVQSADNYVEVYVADGSKTGKHLFRNSLKNLEDQLAENGSFFRCHRSYIVNLQKVQQVRGNARGYRLVLPHCEMEIPVARAKNAAFLSLIKSR